MFYVVTEKEGHRLTTSYVTEKQARRYGGEPIEKDLILTNPGDGYVVYDKKNEDWLDPHYFDGPEGRVRTIFESYRDSSKTGKFLLYRFEEGWVYTGIFFNTMSDANQAVKGPLSGTFSDMLVFEADEVQEAGMTIAELEQYRRDNPPKMVKFPLSSPSSKLASVYED